MGPPTYTSVSTQEVQNEDKSRHVSFQRSILTRRLCIACLCASWTLGVGCIVGGSTFLAFVNRGMGGASCIRYIPQSKRGESTEQYYCSRSLYMLHLSKAAGLLLPLLLNTIITIFTDATGLIHATALRWALGDRLHFNSNLRLFSVVHGRLSFGHLSNVLNAGFVIVSYCASSLVFIGISKGTGSINPGAIVALGIGLTGNAVITTWQLYGSEITTWSSSPIDTAWASLATGQRRRTEGRCMMSVHDNATKAVPSKPKLKQRCAWSAHRETSRILVYLGILFILSLVGFVAALVHTNLNDEGDTMWDPDRASDLRNGVSSQNADITKVFLVIMALQSFLTMGLHCVDLLVNMSRDEDLWRKSYTSKGYIADNTFKNSFGSWKTLLLFAMKPTIHWLFGQAFTTESDITVSVHPMWILYLTIGLLILALFGTLLCLKNPKGPQPATFGHIQTLINLIDVWDDQIFWGHKSSSEDGLCHAGTAKTPLRSIMMKQLYASKRAL